MLPSRVNPTTAAISIVFSSSQRKATIEYRYGSQEHLQLPTTGAKEYLDAIITTKIQKAQQIHLVRIQVPGRLAQLQADIVDTPGVNDLYQEREEITFG